MIGALVAVISLNLTNLLISQYGVIAGTLPVTGATQTSPIKLTVANHGFPAQRTIHGIVSNVTGAVEANGLWAMTVVDANTLSLSTFSAQGLPVLSPSPVNPYAGGGQIQWALPDGQILLGRRNVALSTSVASPRFVFIPTDGPAWGFEAYGGAAPNIAPAKAPPVRGSLESQSMHLQPQLATQFLTFEIHVTGSGPNFGNALSPDFYDFDATQALVFILYSILADGGGPPRAKVLRETWSSQKEDSGTQTQRGQKWIGIVQMQEPVVRPPVSFVPIGTFIQMTVEPINPASGDPTVFNIHQTNGP